MLFVPMQNSSKVSSVFSLVGFSSKEEEEPGRNQERVARSALIEHEAMKVRSSIAGVSCKITVKG